VITTLLLLGGAWMTQGPTDAFGEVAAEVRRGISRGLYPGAVVVVGRQDTILYAEGFGRFTWDRRSHVPKPAESLWDIASLTRWSRRRRQPRCSWAGTFASTPPSLFSPPSPAAEIP
jgi:hypothetical protein